MITKRSFRIESPFNQGKTRVLPGGKLPKLRFRPGTFIEWRGKLHEILYAFRLKDAPGDWRYALGERTELKSRYRHLNPNERVVYELFHSWYEATCHFLWAANESTTSVSTKSILQDGKEVSSGEILPGDRLVKR
jgi:hypothetical protein